MQCDKRPPCSRRAMSSSGDGYTSKQLRTIAILTFDRLDEASVPLDHSCFRSFYCPELLRIDVNLRYRNQPASLHHTLRENLIKRSDKETTVHSNLYRGEQLGEQPKEMIDIFETTFRRYRASTRVSSIGSIPARLSPGFDSYVGQLFGLPS